MNDDDNQQVGHAYSWLSNHGQINFDVLKELAQSRTPESLERLHGLADDNNISYDEATDPMELAEKIYGAMTKDTNIGVE